MPSERVQAALDEFKAALVEEGMDETTVDAQTRMILPSEVTLGGNYADLQRLGASSLASDVPGEVPGVVMPQQPISEPTLTSEPTDPTVEATASLSGMSVNAEGSGSVPPEEADAPEESAPAEPSDGDRGAYEQMTKAELQEEAESRTPPVEVSQSMTKAEMIEALEAADG